MTTQPQAQEPLWTKQRIDERIEGIVYDPADLDEYGVNSEDVYALADEIVSSYETERTKDKARIAELEAQLAALPHPAASAMGGGELSAKTLQMCIKSLGREEYIAGCVDDGVSPQLRELWSALKELREYSEQQRRTQSAERRSR